MRLTHKLPTYRVLSDPASSQKETGIGDVRQVTREIVRRADEGLYKRCPTPLSIHSETETGADDSIEPGRRGARIRSMRLIRFPPSPSHEPTYL